MSRYGGWLLRTARHIQGRPLPRAHDHPWGPPVRTASSAPPIQQSLWVLASIFAGFSFLPSLHSPGRWSPRPEKIHFSLQAENMHAWNMHFSLQALFSLQGKSCYFLLLLQTVASMGIAEKCPPTENSYYYIYNLHIRYRAQYFEAAKKIFLKNEVYLLIRKEWSVRWKMRAKHHAQRTPPLCKQRASLFTFACTQIN